MDKGELSQITDLAGIQNAPRANVLVPDVRSGSTFSYKDEGSLEHDIPPFLVVWFYTVEPDYRALFADNVNAFEAEFDALPDPAGGLKYRGTYSVSISSASPELEYRTIWALGDLSHLKTLNDYIRTPNAPLSDVLKLISAKPVMRSEIIGLTKSAVPKVSL